MLEALIVISIITGIRYLLLANRPFEKLDEGDIAYINKIKFKKYAAMSIPEFQNKLKSKGITLLIVAGVLIVLYIIIIAAMVSAMLSSQVYM